MQALPPSSNTFGLEARAERVVCIRDEGELGALAAELRRAGRPLTVLGGGSNVVLKPRLDGVVALMRSRGIALAPLPDGSVRLTAAAGERWHDLVRFSLAQGLFGLENLVLIPGSVGAAPIQNIGAYGVELADRFVALRALDLRTGRVHEFDREACAFGYRASLFKTPEGAHLVVLDVSLRLSRVPQPAAAYSDLQRELSRLGCATPSPVQLAEAVIRVRRRKLPDPRRVGNAGSFFKNPVVPAALADRIGAAIPSLNRRPAAIGPAGSAMVKLSAAQLIDACGWKGRGRGGAAVWHRQPLVLVNTGTATAAAILALGEDLCRDVEARFGVTLELEPRVIGQD